MKKSSKIIAVILCVLMAFSTVLPAYAADENPDAAKLEKEGNIISYLLNTVVNDILLGTLAKILPNLDFVREDTDEFNTEYFYAGNDKFIPCESDSYTWSVGYGSASILPEDFGVMFKYARGSYAPWGYSTKVYKDEDGNDETMKVRTVVLDDNTGRGKAVICSVDCIGISNVDVKKIRAAMADLAKENDIVSIDVSAIHSHMAIDSQGVWGAPLTTVAQNFLSLKDICKTKNGVNQDYLNTIINSAKASVEEALADMKEGTLTYTNCELEGYMGARDVSHDVDGDMHKLEFVPSDSSRSTVIASFGAHPEVTSYGTEFCGDLSSDFVYYMEKLVNSAGSNFMYVQGNVGTNSCGRSNSNDGLELADNHESARRYGYEMAYILLGAAMNESERAALNTQLGDKLGVAEHSGEENYTVWYDGLATFEEVPVEAVLNVKHQQVKLRVDNATSLILLKLGLATNDLAYDKETKRYYTVTEIGYMEFGTALKVFQSPGELYSELVVGGYGLRNSSYKSLRETYGENVIVLDLMNDAAGYVCPDETYSVVGFKYDPESGALESDTWCLAVSIGKHTASTLMAGYADLVASCR